MGKITVTPCDIEGLYVIEPTVFKDERGYFVETYNQNDMKEAGLDMVFVQDNILLLDGRFAFAGYSSLLTGATDTFIPACLKISQANSYHVQIPSFVA